MLCSLALQISNKSFKGSVTDFVNFYSNNVVRCYRAAQGSEAPVILWCGVILCHRSRSRRQRNHLGYPKRPLNSRFGRTPWTRRREFWTRRR